MKYLLFENNVSVDVSLADSTPVLVVLDNGLDYYFLNKVVVSGSINILASELPNKNVTMKIFSTTEQLNFTISGSILNAIVLVILPTLLGCVSQGNVVVNNPSSLIIISNINSQGNPNGFDNNFNSNISVSWSQETINPNYSDADVSIILKSLDDTIIESFINVAKIEDRQATITPSNLQYGQEFRIEIIFNNGSETITKTQNIRANASILNEFDINATVSNITVSSSEITFNVLSNQVDDTHEMFLRVTNQNTMAVFNYPNIDLVDRPEDVFNLTDYTFSDNYGNAGDFLLLEWYYTKNGLQSAIGSVTKELLPENELYEVYALYQNRNNTNLTWSLLDVDYGAQFPAGTEEIFTDNISISFDNVSGGSPWNLNFAYDEQGNSIIYTFTNFFTDILRYNLDTGTISTIVTNNPSPVNAIEYYATNIYLIESDGSVVFYDNGAFRTVFDSNGSDDIVINRFNGDVFYIKNGNEIWKTDFLAIGTPVQVYSHTSNIIRLELENSFNGRIFFVEENGTNNFGDLYSVNHLGADLRNENLTMGSINDEIIDILYVDDRRHWLWTMDNGDGGSVPTIGGFGTVLSQLPLMLVKKELPEPSKLYTHVAFEQIKGRDFDFSQNYEISEQGIETGGYTYNPRNKRIYWIDEDNSNEIFSRPERGGFIRSEGFAPSVMPYLRYDEVSQRLWVGNVNGMRRATVENPSSTDWTAAATFAVTFMQGFSIDSQNQRLYYSERNAGIISNSLAFDDRIVLKSGTFSDEINFNAETGKIYYAQFFAGNETIREMNTDGTGDRQVVGGLNSTPRDIFAIPSDDKIFFIVSNRFVSCNLSNGANLVFHTPNQTAPKILSE